VAVSVTSVFEAPHDGLRDSYRSLVREFLDRGEKLVPFPLAFAHHDFPAFLALLASCAKGEGLRPGAVPHSTYWLVRDGQVVGVSNLRHRLTDEMRISGGNIGYGVRPSARRQGVATEILKHTLARARELGVPEAWLTCAWDNEASIRTILRNGGTLVSEEFLPARDTTVRRYRVPL
jgi:predicted acetyltransferase